MPAYSKDQAAECASKSPKGMVSSLPRSVSRLGALLSGKPEAIIAMTNANEELARQRRAARAKSDASSTHDGLGFLSEVR